MTRKYNVPKETVGGRYLKAKKKTLGEKKN